MTYMNTTTTAAGMTPSSRSATFFHAAFARVKTYLLYRETLSGLSALTDRELADLGLYRSGLRDVARTAARNAMS